MKSALTGATEDAARIDRSDAPTLTKIPVLPISYADAQPLLEALDGPVAPTSWRGGLPLTYHVGPGPARVRLALAFDWKLEPIYDVIAKLEGQEFPNEWVIHGNHHDAWVNGAADPISGMVALMEEARAIGHLAANGWRPQRTIVFAAWDGEEPGLLGSTEWAELHAELLADQAVAYINTDGYLRGFLNMGGSHTLERFINEVATMSKIRRPTSAFHTASERGDSPAVRMTVSRWTVTASGRWDQDQTGPRFFSTSESHH